jgi:hypothetical protein
MKINNNIFNSFTSLKRKYNSMRLLFNSCVFSENFVYLAKTEEYGLSYFINQPNNVPIKDLLIQHKRKLVSIKPLLKKFGNGIIDALVLYAEKGVKFSEFVRFINVLNRTELKPSKNNIAARKKNNIQFQQGETLTVSSFVSSPLSQSQDPPSLSSFSLSGYRAPEVNYSENIKLSKFSDYEFLNLVLHYFGYIISECNSSICFSPKYSLLQTLHQFELYGFTPENIFGYLFKFSANSVHTSRPLHIIQRSISDALFNKLSIDGRIIPRYVIASLITSKGVDKSRLKVPYNLF